MGKQRVTQLLEQLKENQAKDLENAAAIYTVAQIAVDELHQSSTLPAQLASATLPVVNDINKNELIKRYGSFNGCRKAAKEAGIQFKKTPSWLQLEAAFRYQEAYEKLVKMYMQAYPNEHLSGVSFTIYLGQVKRPI